MFRKVIHREIQSLEKCLKTTRNEEYCTRADEASRAPYRLLHGLSSVFSNHSTHSCYVHKDTRAGTWIQRSHWGLTLTRVAVVEEGGGASTACKERQRRGHESLHDATLPRAQTQTAGWHKRELLVSDDWRGTQLHKKHTWTYSRHSSISPADMHTVGHTHCRRCTTSIQPLSFLSEHSLSPSDAEKMFYCAFMCCWR